MSENKDFKSKIDHEAVTEGIVQLVYNVSFIESKKQGLCVHCKQKAEVFDSNLAKINYTDLGLCQTCQYSDRFRFLLE